MSRDHPTNGESDPIARPGSPTAVGPDRGGGRDRSREHPIETRR